MTVSLGSRSGPWNLTPKCGQTLALQLRGEYQNEDFNALPERFKLAATRTLVILEPVTASITPRQPLARQAVKASCCHG